MPIFDQGYQHWSGQVSSHHWRWLAITRRGVRNAFGSRVLRMLLFAAWVPAVVLVFVLCMWGLVERQSELVEMVKPLLTSLLGRPILAGPQDYRVEIWTICFHYFLSWELWFSMVLVLIIGPNLISQDLRYNALPLYFSRPLRRVDYFLGKLGVIVVVLSMVTVLPTIIAYLFGLLFSLDWSIFGDTFRIFIGSVGYGLVIAISAGMLMLALSSLSRNSRYVALMWVGLWILTSTVSAILVEIHRENRVDMSRRAAIFGNGETIAREVEAAESNWRPLVSYTANLRRIGELFLGSNAAWERLGELSPPSQRGAFLLRTLDTRYPWQWSAGVLILLLILSALVLHLSVKSLDRAR